MASNNADLQDTLRHWTLVLGVAQVTFGCVVGLIPPSAVEWFRGLVMAHIEFTANGVLMVVAGLLVREMRLAPTALRLWFVALQIGTWGNGAAGLVGAFIGASAPLLPTLNEKFPPPHGADSALVGGLLVTCAVMILTALVLTLYGLLRGRVGADG